MTDRLDRYSEHLQALIGEAVACSPETWSEGRLTIECDGSYMNYALKNEASNDKAQISGPLRQLCEDIYVVMRQSGDWWTAASIHFFRKDEGWSFNVDFTYPKSEASSEPDSSLPNSPDKPWWKGTGSVPSSRETWIEVVGSVTKPNVWVYDMYLGEAVARRAGLK